MLPFDVLESATKCADQLQSAGFSTWSCRILDAIGSGSTGGEIVTSIRHVLRRMLEDEKSLPMEIVTLSSDIIREIDRTGW